MKSLRSDFELIVIAGGLVGGLLLALWDTYSADVRRFLRRLVSR